MTISLTPSPRTESISRHQLLVSNGAQTPLYRKPTGVDQGGEAISDWNSLSGEHASWVADGRPGGLTHFVTRAVTSGVTGDSPLGRAAAALMALRPQRFPAAPPATLWQRLSAEIEAAATNPIDVVIAFGCGWRREVFVGTGAGWLGRWNPAITELVAIVRAATESARHLLSTVVPELEIDRDDIVELPSLMAVGLMGSCDCEHHVRGCRSGDRCTRRCCFPDHDLADWDPAHVAFRAFVDQAVRGEAIATLRGGAFAESMLYRLLESDGRVLVRKVEVARCRQCRTDFEGPRCPAPDCGAWADEATPRRARSNWLIVPEVVGGPYSEVSRLVCGDQGCARLFPKRRDPRCPTCGWEPPPDTHPKSASVWLRLARSSVAGGSYVD